jgi:hypothetical protein
MEKVFTNVPGNHVGTACTFARHCGHLEAALYVLGIPFTEVAPAMWMKKTRGVAEGQARAEAGDQGVDGAPVPGAGGDAEDGGCVGDFRFYSPTIKRLINCRHFEYPSAISRLKRIVQLRRPRFEALRDDWHASQQ